MPNHVQTKDLPALDRMDIATTARRNDVSARTVRRWLEGGLLFSQVTPRSKILIRPDDVEKFLERRCHAQVDVNVMVHDVMKELTDAAHGSPDRPRLNRHEDL